LWKTSAFEKWSQQLSSETFSGATKASIEQKLSDVLTIVKTELRCLMQKLVFFFGKGIIVF
jgi:hypothetical protein